MQMGLEEDLLKLPANKSDARAVAVGRTKSSDLTMDLSSDVL